MTEMHGLAAIVAEMERSGATIHGITPPPGREEFATEAEYDAAYVEWQGRQYWRATRETL